MVSVRILIEGKKVQGIGYRMFLLEKALLKGIDKLYARNVDKNKVELFVSDEEEKVNSFYEVINKEKPEEAEVDYIKKEPYEDGVSIPPIDRYFHFLTLEQLGRGREEVAGLPGLLGKVMEPLASALTGIDQKFDKIVDRFGAFASYAQGIDERLKATNEKLNGMGQKLDTLPQRIAEVMGANKEKSQH